MIWTVPNIITAARVLAAPFVALVFVIFEPPLAGWLAFVLFAGAAATDYLDGWLARRWGEVSEIGKMLDPIADKAMVMVALAVLTGLVGITLWYILPMTAILLREVLVSGLREYLGDVKLRVTNLAKWKTTAQMVAIGWLLLIVPGPGADAGEIGRAGEVRLDLGLWFGLALLWVAAILTVISGFDYFRKGLSVIGRRDLP